MIDTGLPNRVVLITGANWGIGAATARAFAAQGARVAIHYLAATSQGQEEFTPLHVVAGSPAADELISQIRRQGGLAMAVAGDLMDPTTVPSLFDQVEEGIGPVDVLVNNAAHCERVDTSLMISAGCIDRTFSVNTRAVILMTAEFARRCQMRQAQSGRVINLSTDAAQAFATQIAYGASKAATESITRSMAAELGPFGITVNAVAPGPVQTGWFSAQTVETLIPQIPLRRMGRPEDIADAIVFLASDQAQWITGQVLRVCGGHIL